MRWDVVLIINESINKCAKCDVCMLQMILYFCFVWLRLINLLLLSLRKYNKSKHMLWIWCLSNALGPVGCTPQGIGHITIQGTCIGFVSLYLQKQMHICNALIIQNMTQIPHTCLFRPIGLFVCLFVFVFVILIVQKLAKFHTKSINSNK